MNECQLLELYGAGQPGQLPTGYTPGRTIPKPGRIGNNLSSGMARLTYWQGKFFESPTTMTNRMFGIKMGSGIITSGPSLHDGQPAHIIDYRDTSLLFRPFRDEFREVAPGIYLGRMYRVKDCQAKFMTWFAVDARKGCCECWEPK